MIGSSWAQAHVDDDLAGLLHDAHAAAGDPAAALALADRATDLLPLPGHGRTLELWRGLAELAAVDLTVARALEPHLDAQAIFAQATAEGYAVPDTSGVWGVFAAEGADPRLELRDGRLTGRKPWCSLASLLDRALVTAWVSPHERGLVAIDLHQGGVRAVDEPWVARGLRSARSTALDLHDVPGELVGPPNWYLTRGGFAWGGLGVAAVWFGGAAGLARRLWAAAQERDPDQVGLALLGAVDAALTGAGATLAEAAAAVDEGLVRGEHAWPRCIRTRHVVHEACETVLSAAAHGLGPGPLVGEEEHAARVADLQLYLRQHKAERDAAVVGRAVADGMPTAW
ncbi:acyl-CoA/acyl-ACP dehydrogenase [Ornithinimicrobium cerasi]|uniref:acyl-CoA/acyl-ACP dehydrogenase n=1 Tax=Ornithinimicrobium cerasi TaxID=2248773 RepID=UPI000EFE3621|nr:acyl-CoA/acyl-ACP dehydrogenase [Ornithinimicrobium cerasi]